MPWRYRAIPACAGETGGVSVTSSPALVYPRVCGGNLPGFSSSGRLYVLSPRVRGKLPARLKARHLRGSIPACAGETTAPDSKRTGAGVYPRVCGGNETLSPLPRLQSGLSPRVRGKRNAVAVAPATVGSIPACAGETGQWERRNRRL